jgi:archaellum component FlaC
MADHLAMGLKNNVDRLKKQVKSLSEKANTLAAKKSYHDLDAKLK